jgi:hypothetical protein
MRQQSDAEAPREVRGQSRQQKAEDILPARATSFKKASLQQETM